MGRRRRILNTSVAAVAALALALVSASLVGAQDVAPAEGQGGRGGGAPARGVIAPPAGARGGGGANATDPANAAGDFTPKPPVPPLSPADELAHLILPPGFKLELVLAEPDIISPAAIAFDGNGRLYVAEMRTFMRDSDGTEQHEAKSRISMHESSKGDGVFDRHHVFADNLVLPRMILPMDRGILTNETHSDDVVRFTDTNGDGVADTRQVFYTGVGTGRDGNVQHEQSGFIWGLDQAGARTHPALPSDSHHGRRGEFRTGCRTARHRHHGAGNHHGQDWRGNGSPDRRFGGGAHSLRHGQGAG